MHGIAGKVVSDIFGPNTTSLCIKTNTMSSFHFLNKVQPPQVTSLNLPDNVSCVLLKKQTISVEPTPLPILQPDGVLVKVMATGEFRPIPE